jgi:hypothetical protein
VGGSWARAALAAAALLLISGGVALAVGSLSIFGILLDHGGPANPGGGRAGDRARRLASIGRELSFNDPDAENGEDGTPTPVAARATAT